MDDRALTVDEQDEIDYLDACGDDVDDIACALRRPRETIVRYLNDPDRVRFDDLPWFKYGG